MHEDDGSGRRQHERTRYQPDVLKELTPGTTYQLKFVVNDREEDVPEIREIVETLEVRTSACC